MTDQLDMLGEVSPEQLQEILEDDSTLPESQRRWAPMLVDLLRVIEATHARRGMSADAAFSAALDAVTAVAEYFGGRPIYIPRGDRLAIALRDAQIFRRVKAGNHDAIAAEYGLTTLHIYRIYKQQKRMHLRKMQGRLFND